MNPDPSPKSSEPLEVWIRYATSRAPLPPRDDSINAWGRKRTKPERIYRRDWKMMAEPNED